MWKKTEPVRSYLYTLLTPIAAVLAYYGVVSDSATPLWIALATVVLGMPAVEVIRAKVVPMVTLQNPPTRLPYQQTDSTWD